MRAGRIFGAASLAMFVVMFTVLTQIGGVVLLTAWIVAYRLGIPRGRARVAATAAIFLALHVVASESVVPFAASHIADRARLPCGWARTAMLEPASAIFCLANRNYVTVRTYDMAMALAMDAHAADPAGQILYLDAGFPFVDGWPLLPHLSHRNGRSVDLALAYRDGETGLPLPGAHALLSATAPSSSRRRGKRRLVRRVTGRVCGGICAGCNRFSRTMFSIASGRPPCCVGWSGRAGNMACGGCSSNRISRQPWALPAT